MSADAIVLRAHVSQQLLRAAQAEQATQFLAVFAAKLQPELSPEQAQMRLQLLRMTSQLVETEFSEAMDKLAGTWIQYRKETSHA